MDVPHNLRDDNFLPLLTAVCCPSNSTDILWQCRHSFKHAASALWSESCLVVTTWQSLTSFITAVKQPSKNVSCTADVSSKVVTDMIRCYKIVHKVDSLIWLQICTVTWWLSVKMWTLNTVWILCRCLCWQIKLQLVHGATVSDRPGCNFICSSNSIKLVDIWQLVAKSFQWQRNVGRKGKKTVICHCDYWRN